jgi:hypothetical protein
MREAMSIIFYSPDVTRQKPFPENFRQKLYVHMKSEGVGSDCRIT